MPDFVHATGLITEQRDSRGVHDLVFGADEKGEELRTLAPQVFLGGGGTPVHAAYGQFASLVIDALVRVPETGGPAPHKMFGPHRCSAQALRRWWATALAVLGRRSVAEQMIFWAPKQRGAFIECLSALRAEATTAELVSFNLMDTDMELVSMVMGVPQPGFAMMPRWFRLTPWARGGLADEEHGSLHAAAVAEYYSVGRHHFSDGLANDGAASAFASAAEAATERAALSSGHTIATWAGVLVNTKAQMVADYLAGTTWPTLLSHWRGSTVQLMTDMQAVMVYGESGGLGKTAERELLSNPTRTRITLAQILPLWGVVLEAPSTMQLHAALRRLVASATGLQEVYVTLANVMLANRMLQFSVVHCTGVTFAALEFDDRIDEGVRLLDLRRNVQRAQGGSSSGDLGFGSLSSDPKSGTLAGYDKGRLLELKNATEYVTTKRQILAEVANSLPDRAILLGLRGADGLPAHPGATAPRLAPLKVFHDVLLGTKDVYQVDKELEDAVTELRRNLPAFWGRRVAKALGVVLREDVYLAPLSEAMADTAKWAAAPPDFFELALVPVRRAAGASLDALYGSYGHRQGAPPYQNVLVVTALAPLVTALLEDVGVLDTAVDDVSDSTSDVSSPADLFALVADLHGTVGSLSTTPSRMGTLITGALADFGSRRASIRASSDPVRTLNGRLFERGSSRISAFRRSKRLLATGQDTAASLAAAGYTLAAAVLPDPPASSGAAKKLKGKGAGPVAKPESGADIEIKDEEEPVIKEEVKPSFGSLTHGGDRVHMTGGERGPRGCHYVLGGDEGLAATLASQETTKDICPPWLVGLRCGLTGTALDDLCGNAGHKAGTPAHPTPDADLGHRTREIKITTFRVNEDGSKYVSTRSSPGKGTSAGRAGKGTRGGRAGGRAGRAGRALAVAAALSGSGTTGTLLRPLDDISAPPMVLSLATPTLSAVLAPGPHLVLDGQDSASLADRAFHESVAIFVDDGDATLPGHLGGGKMLDWLLRDHLGAARREMDVVVCEYSALLRDALDERAGCVGTAISLDVRPTERPGLHWCGKAQAILYQRSWRRLFTFAPCTDDALSGAQYFPTKAADGRLWRGVKFLLWTMCAPAQATMAEHPRSVIKHLLPWKYQVTQPYMFGPGETGLAEQKETWLYWRGWEDVSPTNWLPPPYVSRIRQVRASNSSDRDALKSRSHPGMVHAIADHAAVASILPTVQPSFETELLALGRRFAERFGEENLPADWADPHCDVPWWVATSIDYAPSPAWVASARLDPALPAPPAPPLGPSAGSISDGSEVPRAALPPPHVHAHADAVCVYMDVQMR